VRPDDQGVVRWTDDNSEVRLLGTNYSPMSAHDYMTVGFYAKDTPKAATKPSTRILPTSPAWVGTSRMSSQRCIN
jgi:hypothetical protein